jgi:hypothetical protein
VEEKITILLDVLIESLHMTIFTLYVRDGSHPEICLFVKANSLREAGAIMIEKKEALLFIAEHTWDEDTETLEQRQETINRMSLDTLLETIESCHYNGIFFNDDFDAPFYAS